MRSHTQVGTEHLLVGLVHESQGPAAKVLEALDIALDDVRARVETKMAVGWQAPSGEIPLTRGANKALRLSLREALQLGSLIGSEHILLGLIRQGEGAAAQVLESLGAEINRARQEILQMLFR